MSDTKNTIYDDREIYREEDYEDIDEYDEDDEDYGSEPYDPSDEGDEVDASDDIIIVGDNPLTPSWGNQGISTGVQEEVSSVVDDRLNEWSKPLESEVVVASEDDSDGSSKDILVPSESAIVGLNVSDNEAYKLSLDEVVYFIESYQEFTGISDVDLKQELIEICLQERLGQKNAILTACKETDKKYLALMDRIMPGFTKLLNGRYAEDTENDELIAELGLATVILMWRRIESHAIRGNMDPLKLRYVIDREFNYYCQQHDRARTEFLDIVTRDWSQIDNNLIRVLNGSLRVLTDLDNLYKTYEKLMEEQNRRVEDDKKAYIIELSNRGYKPISNKDVVAGKMDMHNNLVGIMQMFYEKKKIDSLGYPDSANMVNDALLRGKGKNPKNVDLWSPDIYTLDEDLMFRLFVRENEFSFVILLKLPAGVDRFNFYEKKGVLKEDLATIPLLFSNTDRSYGQTYKSSYMGEPRVCNLGTTRNVSCSYDCIEIILAKNLIDFKNSTWLLRDYIRACQGENNAFSAFEQKLLGERVVVGVMPDALKFEHMTCTGEFYGSGLLAGAAGSGKTAMYDSLMIQYMALKDDKHGHGNGAVVLIDYKEEWVPFWQQVFRQLNVPFYGFDGTLLDPSELKWKVKKGKNKSEVVEQVPFPVPMHLAGILFLQVIYKTIQYICKETLSSDIAKYNSRNLNYDGIPKIPRTFILVDEINSLYNFYNKGEGGLKKLFEDGLIRARLTRSSGFNWILGGQDPSKSIIKSDERNNYKHMIIGGMNEERYEYYNVKQNTAVKEYEQKNRTSEVPHPIMSRGMFYVGTQGNTDLVKSLYVPVEERLDAVMDLKSQLDGMIEFDRLVKYALKKGFFETMYQELYPITNNIAYAALKQLGVISQQEFDMYTEKIFGLSSDENRDTLDDALNVSGTVADTVHLKNTKGSTKSKEQTPNPSINVTHGVNLTGGLEAKQNQDVLSGFGGSYYIDDDATVGDTHQVSHGSQGSPFSATDYQAQSDFINSGVSSQQNDFNTDNVFGQQAPRGNQEHPFMLGQQTHPIGSVHVMQDRHVPMSERIMQNAYTEPVKTTHNPFEVYGQSMNPIACLNALKATSSILLDEIRRCFGDYSRVESFAVNHSGRIIINDIAFCPTFPQEVVEMMPIDIRQMVSNGYLVELFNFKDIYKFKNLQFLGIGDIRLAEGRMRREMGIHPRKSWDVLFNKFRYLKLIDIAGQQIVDADTAEIYEKGGKEGYRFTEKLRSALGVSSDFVNSSRMNKFWESRPVKAATSALGWTVGLKAVTTIAMIAGPWGLLFGGLAVAGAIKNKHSSSSYDGGRSKNNTSMGEAFKNSFDDSYNKAKNKASSRNRR